MTQKIIRRAKCEPKMRKVRSVARKMKGKEKAPQVVWMLKAGFACECFKRGTSFAVSGKGMNGDAATRCEFAENFDVFRIHQGNQVFHDDVDAVFMEIAVVAEAE